MKTEKTIVFENNYVKYVIAGNGENINFIDKATATDYCAAQPVGSFICLKKNGTSYTPSRCTFVNSEIHAEFDETGVSAVVRVTQKERYFVFELTSISDNDIDEFVILNIHLNMPGYDQAMILNMIRNDKFAVCLLALNLKVNVTSVPDTSVQIITKEPFRSGKPVLSAVSYPEFGLTGAKAALIACLPGDIRAVLKEVVREENLPYSLLGGAWALDAAETKGSYLFSGMPDGDITEWMSEESVDGCIEIAKRAGITHIMIYNGRNDWYGHYKPNPRLFPNGLDGMKSVVDKIHSAGLKAGIHTGTACICKDDGWAGPAPDKRLARDAFFTLAEPLTEKAATIFTVEPPENLPTESGYFTAGGTDIVINDEIITYTGISTTLPYGFTGCVRGVNSTSPAAHKRGAIVGHLTERYSLYLPDGKSSLLEEIAANIAEIVNYCGLDMVYFDGAEAMGANGHGWHYIAKIKLAVMAKINRKVLIESACANHHSWHIRSRLGAWDFCHRGAKKFIDRHLKENQRYKNNLLPSQLGWWAFNCSGPGFEATKPDEIEYLCVKCLAHDMPFSLTEVSPASLAKNPSQGHLLDIMGQYELLRLSNYFPESIKEKARQPGAEFKLEQTADEKWNLAPISYIEHKVNTRENNSEWTVRNKFESQPFKCRIQALTSVAVYDDQGNIALAGPKDVSNFAEVPERSGISETDCMSFHIGSAADGVTRKIENADEVMRDKESACCYTAVNSSNKTGWARITKEFNSPLNMDNNAAIGVWVHGDGKGEILNFQLTGRDRMNRTGMADHYVIVDYEGWRYHELIEPEGDRLFDYSWPYSLLSVARGETPYSKICALNIYYNNIPAGETVKCYLGTVKALKTANVTQKNPSVTIGDKTITFPVKLESGHWLEFLSMSDCKLYNAEGTLIQEVSPQGKFPILLKGANRIVFNSEAKAGQGNRTKVTVISGGEPLKE